jgi:hypothetical protein
MMPLEINVSGSLLGEEAWLVYCEELSTYLVQKIRGQGLLCLQDLASKKKNVNGRPYTISAKEMAASI